MVVKKPFSYILHLTNAENGAFKDLLHEDAFLRVHHLIITLLDAAVDFNVSDIQVR